MLHFRAKLPTKVHHKVPKSHYFWWQEQSSLYEAITDKAIAFDEAILAIYGQVMFNLFQFVNQISLLREYRT
jgi:hypothetical protein